MGKSSGRSSVLAGMVLVAAVAGVVLQGGRLTPLPAVPAGTSRGCPQVALERQARVRDVAHPPADAVVACVGPRPITGAQWAHWFAIFSRQFEHPDTQDTAFETLYTLTDRAATENEARQHRTFVTGRDVRRSFEQQLRTRFKRPGSFERYLDASHESTADYLAGLRSDMLESALAHRVSRDELDGLDAGWRQRTTCAYGLGQGSTCGLIAPFAAGPPRIGVGIDTSGIAVDPVTDTLYVSSIGLTLIDGKTCNASVTSGCTRARRVSEPASDPAQIAIDRATRTIYLANPSGGSIVVLDARHCNASEAHCDVVAHVDLGDGAQPWQPVLDSVMHTLYVQGEHRVWAIDTRHCDAQDHGGCDKPPASVALAHDDPSAIAVSAGTLYVGYNQARDVSLVDTRTCGALDTSRCAAQAPALELPVASSALSADSFHDVLYASSNEDGRLFLVDSATCRAAVQTGCEHPRTVRVRESPSDIAIDATTHTGYLAAPYRDGAELLDVATCNPASGDGCGHAALARMGPKPTLLAIDARTRTVYVANWGDASVAMIRTDRCNATTTAGC